MKTPYFDWTLYRLTQAVALAQDHLDEAIRAQADEDDHEAASITYWARRDHEAAITALRTYQERKGL